MIDIVIRNVKEEDIENIVDIKIEGWKTAYKGIINDEYLNNMDRKFEIEKRKKDYRENGFIVATLNNEVIGFCRYIDSNKYSIECENIDCELCALYVKSTMKRQGIGKQLMQYVIKEFKEKGKKRMILWCFDENKSSRQFYEKMGGNVYKYKTGEFGGKQYNEVAYIDDLESI